ncbi:fibroblast growth factor receptor-like [Branchiostoma floridae]|uniref:Fibroblast growth factor receptor-like n=2 Tax=Branchiostoma floridae TaxID=7739 RepID=A0A9J7LT67_BRAFL|nr:fibroblast growth factor receptor-like [Branchiostoma floridae]
MPLRVSYRVLQNIWWQRLDLLNGIMDWRKNSVHAFSPSAPPTPAFSYKSGCSSPYLHGKTCYYGCRSGYYPASGNTERTCNNGVWTGDKLECKKESLFSNAGSLDVEMVWTYRLETGITPLFENWKKLPNTGIASRTTVNVYTSALYMGRIELFGQASLRLKNTTAADEGIYQLFTVFSDGTSQSVTVSVEVDDPCENNDCSSDGGRCVPHGYNFTCFCGPGYVGDGRICIEITPRQPWTTDATSTAPADGSTTGTTLFTTTDSQTTEITPTQPWTTNATTPTDGWKAGTLYTVTDSQTTEDNEVTKADQGSVAKLHLNYNNTSNMNVIFEAWWFKTNGNDLIASRVHPLNASISPSYEDRLEVFSDASLLLKAVELRDAGTYQLLAAFDDVSESLRKDRHLVVHYPPKDVDITPSMTAATGDRVILRAHTSCHPSAMYSWTKVNGSLDGNSIVNSSTGTLTLLKVAVEDGGTYVVDAGNYLGSASNVTVLRVEDFEEPTPDETFDELVPIAVGLALVILSMVAGIPVYRWIKKRQNERPVEDMTVEEVDFQSDLQRLPFPASVPPRPQFLTYEIDRADFELKQQIGKGAFGIVYLASLKRDVNGHLTTKDVVAKTVNEDAGEEETKTFIREIDTTINLRQHVNLLGLIGCCTVSRPPYLLTEYMPYGDLKHFLLKCRKPEERLRDSMYNFTEMKVYQVARQIASGMIFIAQAGYIHGDLAARNILVGKKLLVKIADFGLTTDIYEKGYQRQDGEQKIPLRWMAPERLLREGRYTSKSDIWSFGVVLYEVATLGNVPYPGRERTLLEDLRTGYREPCPPGLQEDLYAMMLRCWQWEEDDRPEFQELYDELDAVVDSMALDYVRPRSSSPARQAEVEEIPSESTYDIPKAARLRLQIANNDSGEEDHVELEMDSL